MASSDTSTYAALYELMPDLLAGDYGAFLSVFDSEGPLAPAALRDNFLDAGNDTPKVLLYLQPGPEPRIRMVHRVTRYTPALGLTTVWDGSVFAMASDVGPGNQIAWVHFPATVAFTRTAYVRVPLVDNMTAAWTAAPAAHLLGPFADNAPSTEAVRTRFFSPVPKAYVPLVMSQDSWTPRQLWEQLATSVVADNRLQMCTPLLKWLRCAGTQSFGADGSVALPGVSIAPLVAPVSDAVLQRRLWGWVTSDLPGLVTRSGTANLAMTDTLQALKAEFSLQRVEAAAARAAAKLPKTLSEKFPEASGGLRLLCEVASDSDLPPFWRTFATLGRKEGFFALGQALDARAEHSGSMGHAPLVTPALYERISNFTFGSRNVDDLTAGLSLFLMTSGLGADAATQRQQATVYQMMYAGTAAPAVEQVLPLITSTPNMPTSMLGLQIALKNYSVLLDVLLGASHRMSHDFRRFVHSWDRITLEVEASFGDQIRSWIPRFMRYLQLSMVQYFNLAGSVGPEAPLPPLNQLIHHVQMRNWPALPPLPSGYLAEPPRPPAPASPRPPVAPPGAPPAAPPSTAGTPVTNLHQDRDLVTHFERGDLSLRSLTTHANARPLPTAEGSPTQICLAHVFRGTCSSNCGRAATHRVLSATERSNVVSLLRRVGIE
jgi:hypothetical protein